MQKHELLSMYKELRTLSQQYRSDKHKYQIHHDGEYFWKRKTKQAKEKLAVIRVQACTCDLPGRHDETSGGNLQ